MNLSRFTVKQLLLAAALARKLDRRRICQDVGITPGYITQFLDNQDMQILVGAFSSLPFDSETKEYQGLGTLYITIAQFIYRNGEKEIDQKK